MLTLLARSSAAVNHGLSFDSSRIMPYLSQLRMKCGGQPAHRLCLAARSVVLPGGLGGLAVLCPWPCSVRRKEPGGEPRSWLPQVRAHRAGLGAAPPGQPRCQPPGRRVVLSGEAAGWWEGGKQ